MTKRRSTRPEKTRTALAAHRSRLAKQGFVRLEVRVRRDDAELVRGVAAALADRERASGARVVLREHFGRPASGLKALLAAAPLEGVDLERDRDVARDVDL